MEYYAAPEGGNHVDEPDRGALIDLIGTLDAATNTFFIVYPADDDLDQPPITHSETGLKRVALPAGELVEQR